MRQAMYRLHGFCQSGNTFKVAFLLRALNQPWEPQFVDFMNGVTRTGEWRDTTNEMGEVPVLDDGERRLTQSGVILSYLASKHGAYGGRSEDERLEALRWLLFDNHKFTSYFATYRFMKAFGAGSAGPGRHGLAARPAGQLVRCRGQAPCAAQLHGRRRPDDRRHLAVWLPVLPPGGERLSVAGRFRHVEAWLERVRALPGWANPYDILPGDYIAPRW